MSKQTVEISIVFKSLVNKKEALKTLGKFGLLQYQRERTDGRKNSLVTISVFVPSLIAKGLIERLNAREEVIQAREIPFK